MIKLLFALEDYKLRISLYTAIYVLIGCSIAVANDHDGFPTGFLAAFIMTIIGSVFCKQLVKLLAFIPTWLAIVMAFIPLLLAFRAIQHSIWGIAIMLVDLLLVFGQLERLMNRFGPKPNTPNSSQ